MEWLNFSSWIRYNSNCVSVIFDPFGHCEMRKLNLTGLFSLMLLGSATFVGCAEGDNRAVNSQEPPAKVEPSTEASGEAASSTGDTAAAADTVPADARPADPAAPEMTLDEPSELAEATEPPAELVIGDPAPPIAISKWINGEPFSAYTPDKVHVVEFWATWCGPCLSSMPHIATLQEEYGDKLAVVGVTAEDDETVSAFMKQTSGDGEKKWSEVLTYRIALDDNGKTNAAFMEAAGQNGIPCAFIVGKTGQIEWIGHPMEIDEPLKQIVEGNWDSEKAKVTANEAKEVREALNKVGPKVDEAVSSGDFETAVKLVDGLIERFPTNKDLPMIRFQCLIGGGMSEQANTTAKTLIENAQGDARLLDQLAWMMVTGPEAPGVDLELALSAAQKAVELTEEKDVSAIETMARVQFRKGNVEDAVSLQKKTLELATNPRQVQQLTAGLKKYEEALQPKEAAPAEPEVKPETPAEPEAKEETPAEPEAKEETPAEPEAN